MGRKHCGKTGSCWLQTFSRNVFKRLIVQTRKNQVWFGKRLRWLQLSAGLHSLAFLRKVFSLRFQDFPNLKVTHLLIGLTIWFSQIEGALFSNFEYFAVKDLTHYQMTNFRLFQTEKVCRGQFQI